MRWLLILLILLNGGFFGWQYYKLHGKHTADTMQAQKGEYDPLTLISELSPEQRQALGVTPKKEGDKGGQDAPHTMSEAEQKTAQQPASEAANPQAHDKPASATPATDMKTAETSPKPDEKSHDTMPAATQPVCYSLGPMGNRKLINRVERRITSMGLKVDKVRNEVESVPTNWIYLGPMKTESEAKRTVQRLHAKGVRDTQIINKGAKNYVISVGLFSTKQGADERLQKLQEAGFTPSLSHVTAKKSHYWLDISYQGGKVVKEKILKDMLRGISGAGVKQFTCKPG